jgi:CBS domain-containing protein
VDEEELMKIRDLMTKQVATVRATDSTAVAARLMWDCDCGAVPVLDGDGRAIAMITDRDICMAALMRDAAPSAIPVSEAMSRTLRFCTPDESVSTAEGIMRTYQIRRIPIVDKDRRPVGMLSLADIVRASERKKGRSAKTKKVAPAEVAGTLAEICAMPPRAPARPASRAA